MNVYLPIYIYAGGVDMSLAGQKIGRYLLQSPLGSGGMGEVYLATDTQINRQVAVKVIRAGTTTYPNAEATKEATRLFYREMRAIAVLDHPHILPLYDFGEEGVITYMVMPYRKEGSLADWLQQRNSTELLSAGDVGHLIGQAARGLQHAHNHNIIHQDVKPTNFLMRNNEEEPHRPTLLLADFGVAKFTSATSSMSHTIRGTPSYMAPEQWEGTPVMATDQYALAIMAYELLTGAPPFQGGVGQMMYQHFHVQPQPPSTRNPRIPQELDLVLLRALAKKPEERFPSIAAFGQAFQQALQSMSTSTLARVPPPKVSPPPSEELRATLAISEEEAQTGTRRTLTLPGGQRVTVAVPPHAQDGQLIRIPAQGDPSGNSPTVPLAITLAVTRTEKLKLPPVPERAEEKTYLSLSRGLEERPVVSNPAVSKPVIRSRWHLSKGRVALLLGLVVLVIIGSFGVFLLVRNAVLPNPYPPHTGTLLLDDALSDNGLTWPQGSDSHGSCAFTSGAYRVSGSTPGFYFCNNGATNFSNFAYQVQMTIISGNSGGTTFRTDAAAGKYYFFRIGLDGSYELGRQEGDQYQTLKNGTSSAINTGLNQSNLIAVVANGSSIDLYVNLHHIDSVSDSTYTSGQVGVAAYSTTGTTEVAFSNAMVWGL
jgi:serine/threonine protein kinase